MFIGEARGGDCHLFREKGGAKNLPQEKVEKVAV